MFGEVLSYEEDRAALIRNLKSIANSGGMTGDSVLKLMKKLIPHLESEDRLLVPVWNNLSSIAAENGSVLESLAPSRSDMAHRYNIMEAEHDSLGESIMEARRSAVIEGRTEVLGMLRRLSDMIFVERTVIFPVALLGYNHARDKAVQVQA